LSLIGIGFASTTTSGFGQSSFGAKPTGTATPSFGVGNQSFGASTSIFGSTTTTTTQPTVGMFGTQTQTAFGAAQPNTSFITPTQNTGFGGIFSDCLPVVLTESTNHFISFVKVYCYS